jgi:hypothetical protein
MEGARIIQACGFERRIAAERSPAGTGNDSGSGSYNPCAIDRVLMEGAGIIPASPQSLD